MIVIGDGLVRILVLTHAEEETWRWDSNMEGPSHHRLALHIFTLNDERQWK